MDIASFLVPPGMDLVGEWVFFAGAVWGPGPEAVLRGSWAIVQ